MNNHNFSFAITECEFISGITDTQYDKGSVIIKVTGVDSFEITEGCDFWSYTIDFINSQTRARGTLTISENMFSNMSKEGLDLKGREFQINFYGADDEYVGFTDNLSRRIEIRSISEL